MLQKDPNLIHNLSRYVLAAVLFSGSPLIRAGNGLDGGLVNPDTMAANWKLPDTAIDTQQIPEVILDPEAPRDAPLPVYRLTDNTYFLFGNIEQLNEANRGWNGNAGFVVTDEGVVVIDALGTPKLGERLIATVRSVTDRPIRYLIVTHNHPDHAYGAAPFERREGVTIIAHEGTVDYNHSATVEQSVDYREQMLPADMRGFNKVQADIYIGGERYSKKRIELGGQVFDVYNTGQHHSYGDLLVHQVEQDILWISDLAFNQRTTYMGDGDSKQILEGQDWLRSHFEDIRLMVPGHGSAQTPPFPMVDKTHRYVTRMREAMRQAVENGVGMYEAVRSVEFEEWKDTRLYEQNQRANANFVYRQMEKAFFEDF